MKSQLQTTQTVRQAQRYGKEMAYLSIEEMDTSTSMPRNNHKAQ